MCFLCVQCRHRYDYARASCVFSANIVMTMHVLPVCAVLDIVMIMPALPVCAVQTPLWLCMCFRYDYARSSCVCSADTGMAMPVLPL